MKSFPLSALVVASAAQGASATYQNCTGSKLSQGLLTAECNAWQDFYDGTGGASWKGCQDSRLDPCGCQLVGGVACNSKGNIIWVYMDSNNLKGQVPASVSAWTKLSAITLSNNHLTGPLPEMAYDHFYQECDLIDHYSGGTNSFDCPLPAGAIKKCNKIDASGNPVPLTDSDCGAGAPTPPPATPTPPPTTPTPPPTTPTPPPATPTPPPTTPTPPPAPPTPPPSPGVPTPNPYPTPSPGGNPYYCDTRSPIGEYVCRQSIYGTMSLTDCESSGPCKTNSTVATEQ